jgi:hypothetical protein
MMSKKRALIVLSEYFVKKGKFMTEREYREQTDTPMRAVLVRRYAGSWSRIPLLIEKNFPEAYEAIMRSNSGPVMKGNKNDG